MNVLVVNSGSFSLKFQLIVTDLERIQQHKDDRICRGEIEGIMGHRVVHGGELFEQSVLIDDRVLKGIEDCIDLAPLHNLRHDN